MLWSATIDPLPGGCSDANSSIPTRPRPEQGSTAETVSHTRRGVGVIRGLGISALCLVSAGAGAAAVSGGSVFAADTTAPVTAPAANDAAGDNSVIIDVVKAVSPAVVTINVTSNGTSVQDPNGLGNGPQGFVQQGTGSGVIIDSAGLILTNHHVVQDADKVSVVLDDGRTFDGTVAGIDTYTDLAFVKIDATDLPTAQLGDSSALRSASWPSPWATAGPVPGPVTSGIVSGLDRTVVVSIRRAPTPTASCTSSRPTPPSTPATRVARSSTATARSSASTPPRQVPPGHRLRHPHRPRQAHHRPGPGGQGHRSPLDRHLLPAARRPDRQGQQAERRRRRLDRRRDRSDGTKTDPIVKDGPAAKAGLKDGDIITAIGGQTIDAEHPLDLVLLTHAPGDSVTLTVLRDGTSQSIDLTLGTRPTTTL